MAARWLRLLVAIVLATGACHEAVAAANFAGWATVVVAGDDQGAHDDRPTKAFDNARHDVAAALVRRGFSGGDIVQFSLHPGLYPEDRAIRTAFGPIALRLGDLASRARDGCLVYFTSHGSPEGILVGDRIVSPAVMASLIGRACGTRPTAVILSACFSGVFLPALSAPNRFVLTAARRDRSSFGCGESDRYPFFDGCVIEDLPRAGDFVDLAGRVKQCVAAREDRERMRPRSRPQLFVGAAFRAAEPAFAAPAG